MLPRKLDITLALKTFALTNSLTAAEKRIAATLLDHFNRENGRCDPSYETMAALLSVNVRTVGRGIAKLVKIDFFRVVTHGGINLCNSYQPNWALFRAFEAQWKRQRREYANRFRAQKMSALPGQNCPTDHGPTALQTCSNNILPLTSSATESFENATPVRSSAQSNGFGTFAARLEKRLGKDDWYAWFRNVHFIDVTREKLILSAPTRFIKSRIEQQFEHKLLDCFRLEYPDIVRVEVVIEPRG
jgi:hypothetical protein